MVQDALDDHLEHDILVIAKHNLSDISVFTGSLALLVKSRSSLHRNQKGDYHFNVRVNGNRLKINEVPEISLSRLGVVLPPSEEEEQPQHRELRQLINRLPMTERKRLLESFGCYQSTSNQV